MADEISAAGFTRGSSGHALARSLTGVDVLADREAVGPHTARVGATADRDVVDEIDRLVDEQLAGYDDRSGYDHNVNQPVCPQPWCGEDFHTLPIKERMREMRRKWRSAVVYAEMGQQVSGDVAAELDAYRYDEDESPVICPGSTFDGEFEPSPATISVDQARECLFTLASRLSEVERLRILAALYPDAARTRDRIIGYDMVSQLRSLRYVLTQPDWWPDDAEQQIERDLAAHLIRAARDRFPDIDLDAQDVRIERSRSDRFNSTVLEGRWWPDTGDIELVGGAAHGRTMTVDDVLRHEIVYAMTPPDVWSILSIQEGPRLPDPVSYRRDGWNPATRRWVYRAPPRSGFTPIGPWLPILDPSVVSLLRGTL